MDCRMYRSNGSIWSKTRRDMFNSMAVRRLVVQSEELHESVRAPQLAAPFFTFPHLGKFAFIAASDIKETVAFLIPRKRRTLTMAQQNTVISPCALPECRGHLGLTYVKRRGKKFCSDRCWRDYRDLYPELLRSTWWPLSWLRSPRAPQRQLSQQEPLIRSRG